MDRGTLFSYYSISYGELTNLLLYWMQLVKIKISNKVVSGHSPPPKNGLDPIEKEKKWSKKLKLFAN